MQTGKQHLSRQRARIAAATAFLILATGVRAAHAQAPEGTAATPSSSPGPSAGNSARKAPLPAVWGYSACAAVVGIWVTWLVIAAIRRRRNLRPWQEPERLAVYELYRPGDDPKR